MPAISDTDLQLTKTSQAYLHEAREARKDRIRLSQLNRKAYRNIQDFDNKIEGQSREFLPKTSTTVEQFAAFLKKGLTDFGDWFSVELGRNSVLSDSAARKILMRYLDNLPEQKRYVDFASKLADGSKVGLLESLMIFKTHGVRKPEKVKTATPEGLKDKEVNPWRLAITLIPPEDYYPDPTGRGLYEIHRSERDYHDLIGNETYDQTVLESIKGDFRKDDYLTGVQSLKRRPNEDFAKPSFRKRIVIDEYWGTILDSEGNVVAENQVWTIANEKYIIRKPEDNPFWHGQSPITVIPLIREPFSVWHKALYDDVVPLNLALNELFNLMLDGGLASVWGIRQVQPEYLEDPNQIAGGIPQGKTLVMRSDAPAEGEVLKQVSSGEVPADALNMFQLLNAEFLSAARTNDLRLGNLPSKQVKATEVVEASQTQSIVLDSIVGDIEFGITEILQKAWFVILQEAPNLAISDLSNAVTPQELRALAVMDAKDRFQTMALNSNFKAFGMSATMAKARDSQKLMAALQIGIQNPLLTGAMLRTTDPNKIWLKLLKQLNINPEEISRDEVGLRRLPEDLQMLQMLTQQGQNAGITGEPGLQSEINQEAKPSEI